MRRISYAGESFLTTDSIADSLLRFVTTLSRSRRPEKLDVPAYSPTGDPVVVQLVVGVSSQFVSLPQAVSFSSLDEDENDLADEFRRTLTERSAPIHSTLASPQPFPAVDPEDIDSY